MRSVILVVVILATTSAGLRQSARAVHSPPEGVGSVHGEDTVRNEVWWKENLLTKASNGTPTLPPIDNTRHHFGTVAIVTAYGYQVENYTVSTEDGYKITLHRILPVGGCDTSYPVFIMHGMLSSSMDWCAPDPKKAIPYLLADLCYDVWLGNARGTTESRIPGKYDPEDAAYWDFDWHEIGKYDLPAFIKFVLNFTKMEKLHYIGHSQGGTSFFVMASEVPGSMSWIRTANIMAPAVYMKCSRSEVLRLLSVDSTDAWLAARALNQAAVLEVLPHNRAVVAFGDLFCSAQTPITQNICYLVIELVGGSNPKQRDTARLNDYMANFPGGGSLKQLAHYGQLMHTHCEEFRQFDYGLLNFARYGAASPPKYNVRPAGECNLTIIYSLNDLLAVKSSIDKIHCQIPNSTIVVVSDPEWTHFDFIIGLGIKEYVNDGCISRILDYDARNPI